MKLNCLITNFVHRTVRIVTVFVLFATTRFAVAAPVTVFGVGYKPPTEAAGLPSEIFRFNQDGVQVARWDISESRLVISATTDGKSLYLAEFGSAINRYSFEGVLLGKFADVSSLAGSRPAAQQLESDSLNQIYSVFGGQSSEPRTSFRLNQNGVVTASYSHPDLVFPTGIDAAVNGDVYILNSANVGVGTRLFKFTGSGDFQGSFPISHTVALSDIAINEVANELYIADEFGSAVHIYDISEGSPVFRNTIVAPGRVVDVFIEPVSQRVFGAQYTVGNDQLGLFFPYRGFELARDGTVINQFIENVPPRQQSMQGIVAVQIPEPRGIAVVLIGIAICWIQVRSRTAWDQVFYSAS